MKRGLWLAGGMAMWMMAGSVCSGAIGEEACYIVKIMGYDRKIEVVTMPESEFKNFDKALKQEQKVFPKALAIVAKEWRADELNKGIAFPGVSLKPRTLVTSQKFPSAAKAEEQLSKLEDQEARKLERQAEREKGNPQGGKGKKDSKKEEIIAQAASMLKAKMDELMAGAGGEAAAGEGAKVEAGGAAPGAAEKGAKAEKVEKGEKDEKGEKPAKKNGAKAAVEAAL